MTPHVCPKCDGEKNLECHPCKGTGLVWEPDSAEESLVKKLKLMREQFKNPTLPVYPYTPTPYAPGPYYPEPYITDNTGWTKDLKLVWTTSAASDQLSFIPQGNEAIPMTLF
jgi:hypothetical protein